MISVATPRPPTLPIHWWNEPVSLKIDDYERVKKGFINRVSKCAGVAAVYEHRGPEYDVGLSDLDLIVVCDEARLQRKDASHYLRLNLDEPNARDIYRGGPVILTRRLFQRTLLNPHWELRHLYGEKIPRDELTEGERHTALFLNAVTQAGHIHTSLSMRREMRSWPVKVTLGVLKGLMHNYRILKPMEEWPPDLKTWWQKLHHLRCHWLMLNGEKYDELAELTWQAIDWAEETCWEMASYLKTAGYLGEEEMAPEILLTPHQQLLIFADTREEGRRLAQTCGAIGNWKVIVLPSFYYLYLAVFLEAADGGFHRTLNRLAIPKVRVPRQPSLTGTFRNLLESRVLLEQDHFAFLRRFGLPGWGCEGEWFLVLEPPKRPESLIGKLKYPLRCFRQYLTSKAAAGRLEKKIRERK